jgi:hypothetical protein
MNNRALYAVSFAFFGMGTRFLVYMLELEFTWAVQLYFLFLLIAVFIGMREYFVQNKELSFSKLFRIGAQIGAIYSLLTSVFTYIFYRFIDTQFFEFMIDQRLNAAKEAGASSEDLEKYSSNLEMVFNAGTQSMATLIGFLFLTFTYAAIVALILTRVPFFGRRV